MSSNDQNPWITKKSELKFENPWIRVVRNDVINPSGGDGEYTVVHFKNRAVSAIPVDKDGYTWLVGQYRFPMESFEWEIPAGGAPEGESNLECAKRELAEETGLVAEQWDLVSSDLQLSNSVTDERACTYVARGLTQGEACPEETEQLKVKRIPLQDAVKMALNGEIRDAFSVVGLLRAQHFLSRND